MFQVSFVLAALLVAEGVVLAHPINYVHRNEPPSIVPRAVPDNDQAVTFTRRSLLEDLYKEIVDDMMESHTLHGKKDPHEEFSATVTTHGDKQSWLGIRGYDIGDVVTRGLSGLEDLETRGYWGDEETLKSRESDNGWMGPTARESDGRELNARDFDDGTVALTRRYKPTKMRQQQLLQQQLQQQQHGRTECPHGYNGPCPMANEPPSAPAISQVRHGGTSTTGSESDDSIKPNAIEPAGHGGTSTPNSEATEHQSKPDSGEPEEQPRPSKSDTASLEAPAPTKGQSLCSKVKCLYSKTKNIFHNLTHPGGFIAYHAALAVSHAMGGDQW